MAKKTINWAAIKKRYLQGEKPKNIAEDYGLTSQQVRSRAHNEKWVEKKETILNRVEQKVESDLETLHTLYGGMILETAKQLIEARKAGLIGLTIQDGEGYSSKFADNDHKAGLAVYLEQIKHNNKLEVLKLEHKNKIELTEIAKQEPNDEIQPGFIVTTDA